MASVWLWDGRRGPLGGVSKGVHLGETVAAHVSWVVEMGQVGRPRDGKIRKPRAERRDVKAVG